MFFDFDVVISWLLLIVGVSVGFLLFVLFDCWWYCFVVVIMGCRCLFKLARNCCLIVFLVIFILLEIVDVMLWMCVEFLFVSCSRVLNRVCVLYVVGVRFVLLLNLYDFLIFVVGVFLCWNMCVFCVIEWYVLYMCIIVGMVYFVNVLL